MPFKDPKRTTYHRRKAAGLCVYCNEPIDPPGSRVACLTCQKAKRDAYHSPLFSRATDSARRERYRENKICIVCKKPHENGTVRCVECGRAQNVYRTKRYLKLRAEGICVSCKKPHTTGHYKCGECATKRTQVRKLRVLRKNSED